MKTLKKFAGLTLVILVIASAANAQGRRDDDRRGFDRDWVELGCERVGRRPDRDVIEVGRGKGRFSAIRLEARGTDISIRDFNVIYAPDEIPVRSEIREGRQTRPYDLAGRGLSIDRIEIVAEREGRGRGTICVYGQRAEDDKREAWDEIGCERIGRQPDRDVIKVGRREGRFSAIRLEARGGNVEIEDLKVVYASGRPDDIRVRSEIREGTKTRPLDLQGRDRAIDRIEIVARRGSRDRGRVTICVEGRKADNDRRR
jgi:hypothetical protein